MRIRTRLTLWYAGRHVRFAAADGRPVLSRIRRASRGTGRTACTDGRRGGAERRGDFEEVATIILWCGVPAALLALAGGWLLMRQALAPLEALTRGGGADPRAQPGEQLPRSGSGDELDRLTAVFNAMTARLDQSFQRIREFTLHASHELKTPLTVMQGELETALPRRGARRRPSANVCSASSTKCSARPDRRRAVAAHQGGRRPGAARAGARALDELVRDAVEDAQTSPRGAACRSAWPPPNR